MNEKIMTNDVINTVPATSIALTGQHLIEASAGTGKTWTLTGIVLRLLIEAKRPPEQIICTTFTRAASAEMRERIMARLNEFFYLLQWLEKISADSANHEWLYLENQQGDEEHPNKNNKNEKEKKQIKEQQKIFTMQREDKLICFAKKTSHDISDSVQDPVNIYLIHYLMDNFVSYSLSMAIRRTQLLLVSMDKLFVGTLDSLAQKWLTEYSVETGYQKGMKISDNDEDIVADIIHDEIRKFHARTHSNNPILYKLLQHSGRLTAVDNHLQSVNKAMQFISAPIDEMQGFDFERYQILIKQFSEQGIEDIQPYFDESYRKKQGINGKTNLFKLLPKVAEIFACIQQYQAMYCLHLEEEHQKFLDTLAKVVIDAEDKGFGFNKNKESERNTFINLPTVQALFQLNQLVNNLDNEIHLFNRHIALTVRHLLPIQLEANNQTTFSLQMVRLNQALSGKQGQKLARYICHHYPVALIDESQDINGEQASMIRSVYMQTMHTLKESEHRTVNSDVEAYTNNQDAKKSTTNTFLLLVGDPKQAIYGFRGGDVANYTAMKKRFRDTYTLSVNRRSNASIVDSLNHWFTADKNTLKELGEGIYYHQIEAFKKTSRLSWHNYDTCNDKYDSENDSKQYDLFLPINDVSTNTSHQTLVQSILGKQALVIIRACNTKNNAKKNDIQEVQGADKYEGLAKHIHFLLQSDETIDGKTITAQDIAILARGRKDLQQASWALEKMGIATVKTAETSVFSSQMATDLLAILQAIQNPFRNDYINRALTTAWYGLSLQQVKHLEKDAHSSSQFNHGNYSYSDFQIHLQKSEQLWLDYGVLSALQFLLGDSLFFDCEFNGFKGSPSKNPSKNSHNKKVSVWEQLAIGIDGERNLLDLRQLLELLTSNTRGMTAAEIIKWLAQQRHKKPSDEDNKQQPIPTEAGVQMMTIHKSKGLEFPIVYVLGLDKSAKNDVKTGDLAFFPYISSVSSVGSLSSSAPHNQRRLSPIKLNAEGIDYQAIVNSDNLGEAKRIAYVALTRASEQVYVVVGDHSNKTALDYRPANIWLESADKIYTLPERLAGHVDWVECADIIKTIESTAETTAINTPVPSIVKPTTEQVINLSEVGTKDNNNLNTANQSCHQSEKIIYPNYHDVIKTKYFTGWRKTSFTALSRQINKDNEDLAVAEPDYLFEDNFLPENTLQIHESIAGMQNLMSDALNHHHLDHDKETSNFLPDNQLFSDKNIRFTFVRGAGAGTFLHQVFELMDFSNPQNWSEQIDKGLREYGLPTTYQSTDNQHSETSTIHNRTIQQTIDNQLNNDTDANDTDANDTNANDTDVIQSPHQQLKVWLTDVINSPLQASGQKLIDIPVKNRKAEMGFDMGLSESFTVEKINDVLVKHLGANSDKLLTLDTNSPNHYYRYLRGEIDLVYTHDNKYYVVDYKSNHLGDDIINYNQDSLNKAMSKAGYWLQALIYQVALHRFLRLRLSDYQGNEIQYLGAVEYLFIRGCVAHQGAGEYDAYGKITWDIPFALIEDMDRAFG